MHSKIIFTLFFSSPASVSWPATTAMLFGFVLVFCCLVALLILLLVCLVSWLALGPFVP
jgi:hypothetical protein